MSAEDRAVTHDTGRDPEDDKKQNDSNNKIEYQHNTSCFY
jgi:hypothetical protein